MTPEQWKTFKERARQQAIHHTWEHRSRELEEVCRRHLPRDWPRVGWKPEPGSDAEIAQRILYGIIATRNHMESGEVEYAALQALGVGSEAGRWPAARAWRRRSEQAREAGRMGGLKQSEKALDLEIEVEALAREIRQTEPYDRARRSTRWLAQRISKELNENFHTVRGHLRRLRLK